MTRTNCLRRPWKHKALLGQMPVSFTEALGRFIIILPCQGSVNQTSTWHRFLHGFRICWGKAWKFGEGRVERRTQGTTLDCQNSYRSLCCCTTGSRCWSNLLLLLGNRVPLQCWWPLQPLPKPCSLGGNKQDVPFWPRTFPCFAVVLSRPYPVSWQPPAAPISHQLLSPTSSDTFPPRQPRNC